MYQTAQDGPANGPSLRRCSMPRLSNRPPQMTRYSGNKARVCLHGKYSLSRPLGIGEGQGEVQCARSSNGGRIRRRSRPPSATATSWPNSRRITSPTSANILEPVTTVPRRSSRSSNVSASTSAKCGRTSLDPVISSRPGTFGSSGAVAGSTSIGPPRTSSVASSGASRRTKCPPACVAGPPGRTVAGARPLRRAGGSRDQARPAGRCGRHLPFCRRRSPTHGAAATAYRLPTT